MQQRPDPLPGMPCPEALFRYQVVSQVLARQQRGESRACAVHAVVASDQMMSDGQWRKLSARTLYRWLTAFEQRGFEGLVPAKRLRLDSRVLAPALLDFFQTQKQADPLTSVPELIRRAKTSGLLDTATPIDRSTVWRALRREGFDTHRQKKPPVADCRRFAYPHRLQMVLCDGKHFRAGPDRHKRVALFFLDDATRLGLGVAVGTAENAMLFLHGLYETLCAYGLMSLLFVDHGPGFISLDAIEVLRKLGVLFIHGRVRYPEGRGKVERFNRTASEQLLRLLDGRPEVDSDCVALELRLRHFMFEQYNHAPHESLDGDTPWQRFQADPTPLRFFDSRQQLQQTFVLPVQRRVSTDHVLSFDGIKYETPRGYARKTVTVYHNLLENSVAILHDARLLTLSPLDASFNARSRRATHPKAPDEPRPALPKSSAELAFENDLRPVVDPDGGFVSPKKEDSS